MKTLVIVYAIVVTVVVGGITYINHEIDLGVREHQRIVQAEYVPQVDITGRVEPVHASEDVFLASYGAGQGITEPWDVQAAAGYRILQPTERPQ